MKHLLNSIFKVRLLPALLFSALILMSLTSCMDEGDDLVSEPVEVAYVSIYHASPDAPELDIVVDDRVINQNPFDYSAYSGYLNFLTGNRNIQFNSGNAANTLVDTTFNFEDGKAYSLFAINNVANMEALLIVDSSAAPAAGKAMVRFVNLAPDAPAYDVIVAGGSGDPLFEGLPFKQATQFQEVDADTYSFEVKNAGETDVVVAANDVEILPGRFYTIITRGFTNPPAGNNNLLSIEVID